MSTIITDNQGTSVPKITKRFYCRSCGSGHSIDGTAEQWKEFELPGSERPGIQRTFPELSLSERELMILGFYEICFHKMEGQ